jgi:glyoxylase-like metal-dependent hydrolase (beta-lactamase superfamily II)/rhodanese-related sulfurtransferase
MTKIIKSPCSRQYLRRDKTSLMIIEQMYTGCLAHGAYYIQSNDEAAVIDPLRDINPYIAMAARHGARLRYVLETHFHADFVSGHVDLARATGAEMVFGPDAITTLPVHRAMDGEVLPLGAASIKVLHTPGHTPESVCYLLLDEKGLERALFTGDTLFLGDAGRPDLAQELTGLNTRQLAGQLYDSLRNKIMPLPDELLVYPGHGAGSACGKHMSPDTVDTLGHQKATNYTLQPELTREAFIDALTADLAPPPAYFPLNAALNRRGYAPVDEVLRGGNQSLDPRAFRLQWAETNAVVLDIRSQDSFCKSFIPGSINIGIDGAFAPWAGTLIPDLNRALLLVADPGRETEGILRLARVGLDHCIGYLDGGFDAWRNTGFPLDHISSVSTTQLPPDFRESLVIDVRKPDEYSSGHITGAINLPLERVMEDIDLIRRLTANGQTGYVYCAGGYRSVIFLSILYARGIRNLINVEGGYRMLQASHAHYV